MINVVICPGFHDPKLTQGCLDDLRCASWRESKNILVYPGESYLALSGVHIWEFLRKRLEGGLESPVVFISFSAGVVGAYSAAWGWQLSGGNVLAFIAVDGWGVPLSGFPIHRISHDYFTHWSSAMLGSGGDSFYADPAVEHLDLWRSPGTAKGWWVNEMGTQRCTAAQFVTMLVNQYDKGDRKNAE